MTFPLLLILGLGAFAWIAFRSRHVAFPLFIALLPTYLIRFSIGVLPTTFLEACFWLLFGGWVFGLARSESRGHEWNLFLKRTLRLARQPKVLTVLGLLLFVSICSLLVPPREHLVSSIGLWRAYLLEPVLFGWMAWHVLRDQEVRFRSFLSLVLSGFILAVLGFFQYTTRLGIPAPWDIEGRITSVFDYPNALGLFLAPLCSALFVFGISTWKKRLRHEKIFVIATSIAMLLAITLAKTEAALVAIPSALFVTFFASPSPSRKQKIAGTFLATIILLGALIISPIREKLLLQDFSGGVRLSQWRETLQLLADHPLVGAGFGYYPELLRTYHTDWQYEIFQYPHNILLNVWVELGILGVVMFLGAIVLLAKKVWERRGDALVLAAGAALLTMCIHGLVDVPFFKNDLAMMTAFFVVLVFTKKKEGAL